MYKAKFPTRLSFFLFSVSLIALTFFRCSKPFVRECSHAIAQPVAVDKYRTPLRTTSFTVTSVISQALDLYSQLEDKAFLLKDKEMVEFSK
jgi:hypothetical protein